MYGLSSLMKLLRLFLFSILSLQFSLVFGQPSTGSDEEVVAQIAVYIWAKGSYGDLLDRDGNLIYKYTPPEVKMAGPNGEVIDLMVFPNRRTPFVKYQGAQICSFLKRSRLRVRLTCNDKSLVKYNFRLRLRVHCCYFIQEIKQ